MPPFRPFLLERWFAAHEQQAEHQLGASDCEPLRLGELLGLCDTDPLDLLDVWLGYGDSRGDPGLREAIAAHYPRCSAADVLVAGAPQEAILLTMQALLSPGDRVVVLTPCYQSLRELPLQLGCNVDEWRLRRHGDAFALDWDALHELLRSPARLVVTNFPHNPTGLQPTLPEWHRLVRWIDDSGAVWLSDEMYRGLAPRDELELPPAASLSGRALSLWGLSKSFGMPGLRLGWLACRDRALLAAVEARKDFTSICNNAVSELAARLALDNASVLLERNRAIVAANLEHVAAFAARHREHVSWTPPQAGPVGVAKLATGTAADLARRLLPRALAVPSHLFDLPDAWVRLGLGRRDLLAALQCWEQLLDGRP